MSDDLLARVRTALAASAQAGEPDVAAEELRQLELLLVEREREAARGAAPRLLSIAQETPRP